MLGPHFYIFIPTWFVAIGLIIYIMFSVRERASPILLALSGIFSIIFLYCYLKVGFSKPGIASSNQAPDFSMRTS